MHLADLRKNMREYARRGPVVHRATISMLYHITSCIRCAEFQNLDTQEDYWNKIGTLVTSVLDIQ